jgi:hypothetical protein
VDLHGSYEAVRPAVTGHAVEVAAEKNLFPIEGKSRYLQIGVWEHDMEKAKVTFRASAAENLPDLVPPEIEGKLIERGIDVPGIALAAKNANFPPGELFRLEEGAKKFRVWLE